MTSAVVASPRISSKYSGPACGEFGAVRLAGAELGKAGRAEAWAHNSGICWHECHLGPQRSRRAASPSLRSLSLSSPRPTFSSEVISPAPRYSSLSWRGGSGAGGGGRGNMSKAAQPIPDRAKAWTLCGRKWRARAIHVICTSAKTRALGLPCWSSGWDFTFQCRGCGFNPWSGSYNPTYLTTKRPTHKTETIS